MVKKQHLFKGVKELRQAIIAVKVDRRGGLTPIPAVGSCQLGRSTTIPQKKKKKY